MDFHQFILLLGNISYVLLMSAYLMRDIFYLRLIAICASLLAIIYDFFYAAYPLWIDVVWESAFCSVNIFQLGLLIYEKKMIVFNPEERKLYRELFPSLSLGQFKRLIRTARFASLEKGALITEQNQPVSNLSLILKGNAHIEINGKPICLCREGNLIGEMSFIQGTLATATVEVTESMRCVQWDQHDLRQLFEEDPEIQLAFQKMINVKLVEKFATAR